MKKNTEPITIVTTRDPSHSRYGLRHLIAGDARFQLLAEVVSSPELLYTVAFHRPRVVLADLHLPGQELIEACRTIRRLYPATGIVALCLSGEGDQVSQAVGAGAAACLLHEEVSTSLLQALHTVAEGRLYGNAVMKSTLQQLYARENDPADAGFTPSELQVISLICRQHTGPEIANALSLSLRTVEEIRVRVQEKLGVRSGVGIALYALKKGLVRVD